MAAVVCGIVIAYFAIDSQHSLVADAPLNDPVQVMFVKDALTALNR